MRIAVLMTCHNREQKTLACLQSLERAVLQAKASLEKVQVFLVDDGSTDGTSAKVREYTDRVDPVGLEFPFCVHLIEGDGDLFWAKGMRRAWESAVCQGGFDAYLWLNDDVMLKPQAITTLLSDFAFLRPTASVVIGATSTDESETESSYSATTQDDDQIFPCGAPQRADGWFNGNCVFVPREVYERVGMIDDGYSHGRADYDYAERLKKAGIPFYCASKFVGVCVNDGKAVMAKRTFVARIRELFTPSNSNAADLWRFRVRYYGAGRAIKSCAYLIYCAIRGAR